VHVRRFFVDVDDSGEDVAFAYLLREEIDGSLKELPYFRRVLSSMFFKRMFINPLCTEISNSSRALCFAHPAIMPPIRVSVQKLFALVFRSC
jgi:hypothetical protein